MNSLLSLRLSPILRPMQALDGHSGLATSSRGFDQFLRVLDPKVDDLDPQIRRVPHFSRLEMHHPKWSQTLASCLAPKLCQGPNRNSCEWGFSVPPVTADRSYF